MAIFISVVDPKLFIPGSSCANVPEPDHNKQGFSNRFFFTKFVFSMFEAAFFASKIKDGHSPF
jgi:hypothetical protein